MFLSNTMEPPESWGVGHQCPKFWGVRTATTPTVAAIMLPTLFLGTATLVELSSR